MASSHRDELASAFVSLSRKSKYENVTFTDVIEFSDISRATAYRSFPRGIEGIVLRLHHELVRSTINEIQQEVTDLVRLGFEDAVRSGVFALFRSLEKSTLVGDVFGRDLDVVAHYLLSQTNNSLMTVLVNFVERCAASFGSPRSDLNNLAKRFVWTVVTEIVADLRFGSSDWPNAERLGKILEPRITEFVDALGFVAGDLQREHQHQAITPYAAEPSDTTTQRLFVFATATS